VPVYAEKKKAIVDRGTKSGKKKGRRLKGGNPGHLLGEREKG